MFVLIEVIRSVLVVLILFVLIEIIRSVLFVLILFVLIEIIMSMTLPFRLLFLFGCHSQDAFTTVSAQGLFEAPRC